MQTTAASVFLDSSAPETGAGMAVNLDCCFLKNFSEGILTQVFVQTF